MIDASWRCVTIAPPPCNAASISTLPWRCLLLITSRRFSSHLHHRGIPEVAEGRKGVVSPSACSSSPEERSHPTCTTTRESTIRPPPGHPREATRWLRGVRVRSPRLKVYESSTVTRSEVCIWVGEDGVVTRAWDRLKDWSGMKWRQNDGMMPVEIKCYYILSFPWKHHNWECAHTSTALLFLHILLLIIFIFIYILSRNNFKN